jgi:predicted nucleic acid-binding protein
MRVLVDTNILLRSAQPNHPLCYQAAHAVSRLLRQNHSVFFCPQNIAEFWNVATRPTKQNGLGFSAAEAMREVDSIEASLSVLPDVPAIYPVWKRIVHDYGVQGVKVYDARLVAIMSAYAVESILSFNSADFKRYDLVTALDPASLPD